MKYAFYLLLALLAAVIIADALQVDSGYVLLSWRGTSVEMSLGTLVVLILVVFFGLYLLTTLVVRLWAFPRRIREAMERRREARSRRSAIRGLIDLAEGRWADSERNLMRHAVDSRVPLITYIAAARAAQMQGAHERPRTPICGCLRAVNRRPSSRCCSRRQNCKSRIASRTRARHAAAPAGTRPGPRLRFEAPGAALQETRRLECPARAVAETARHARHAARRD